MQRLFEILKKFNVKIQRRMDTSRQMNELALYSGKSDDGHDKTYCVCLICIC